MSVTIQHLSDQATFEQGQWSSTDQAFADLLNASIPHEMSPAGGRVDVQAAEAAVRQLGGNARIVTISPEDLPDDAIA